MTRWKIPACRGNQVTYSLIRTDSNKSDLDGPTSADVDPRIPPMLNPAAARRRAQVATAGVFCFVTQHAATNARETMVRRTPQGSPALENAACRRQRSPDAGVPVANKDVIMADSTGALPRYLLRIERGRTRFPERPLGDGRFLIGAGSNCQLQLGGETPILHSIIIPDGDHLWIDAVAPHPPLMLNGQRVRESEVYAGDVIEIGEFIFSIGAAPAEQADAPAATQTLSAASLVAALEQEMSQLDQLSGESLTPAVALIDAARRASTEAQPDLLAELQSRAEELDRREEELRRHASELEQRQLLLQQQLERACEKLGQPDAKHPEFRRIA